MRKQHKHLVWLTALACILLAGCNKAKLEQPVPATADQLAIQALQDDFAQKHYEQVVNPTPTTGATKIKWVPQWQAAIWKTGTSVNRSVYIPLQSQFGNDSRPIPMRGVLNYLRFQQVAGIWTGTLFSCFYKLPKGNLNDSPVPILTSTPLHSFTGDVFTKQLESGTVLHSTYVNGVWQNPANKRTASRTANNCKAYYYCSWWVYCEGNHPEDGPGTGYTTFGENCDEPYGFTLGCGYYTRYELQQQIVDYYVCDDGGSGPDPDPGPSIPERMFPDGIYTIGDPNCFRFMSVGANSQQAGANIFINTYDTNTYPSERWQLTYDDTDGYYTIQSVNSGLMLQSFADHVQTNANVSQEAATGQDNQKWLINPSGSQDGYGHMTYSITSKSNVLSLAVPYGCGEGASVLQMNAQPDPNNAYWQAPAGMYWTFRQ